VSEDGRFAHGARFRQPADGEEPVPPLDQDCLQRRPAEAMWNERENAFFRPDLNRSLGHSHVDSQRTL
jgi:hypothetical protein